MGRGGLGTMSRPVPDEAELEVRARRTLRFWIFRAGSRVGEPASIVPSPAMTSSALGICARTPGHASSSTSIHLKE
jgi:hypothetical protein